MKIYLDCLPCILNQLLRATRAVTGDETVQRQVLDAMATIIPELSLEVRPPEIVQHG